MTRRREWNGAQISDARAEALTLGERLLARVMELGDYVQTDTGCEVSPAGVWLVVPLDWALVEALERLGSIDEDHELEIAEADTGDDEPEHAWDENADDEPSVVYPHTMGRWGLDDGGSYPARTAP